MHDNAKLIQHLSDAIQTLLQRGRFENSWLFRPTQRSSLEAYAEFLGNSSLPLQARTHGYFEIPTGVGKTALFGGLINQIHLQAEAANESFRTVIAVPTKNLLYQTKKEFEGELNDEGIFIPGIAPTLSKKIGIYGGGRTELDKPVTIMTYASWDKLVTGKFLSPENVDLLITDESHNATSPNRIKNLRTFSDGTVCLAFTATATFDDEKTVEKTHKHCLFRKTLRQAEQDQEVAAYINARLMAMQVFPPTQELRDQFDTINRNYLDQNGRLALYDWVKTTWNAKAVEFYKDLRDEVTGDLLTDNQAGFYVVNTAQADHLANLLNADPVLQQRAAAQGRTGVAVSIHTREMNDKEQKRRIEAYEAGEYMAIVGDNKFKEGYDYKPMKTVIDYPHGSKVEKAQILGRGARQWWNPSKQRHEGLTFIDTLIYIGSENPEENKSNLDRAISRAITAKQILEDKAESRPHKPYKSSEFRGAAKPIIGPATACFVEEMDYDYFLTRKDQVTFLKKLGVTIQDVLDSARIEYETTKKRPHVNSGEVLYGPLAGKTTWNAVNGAISSGFLSDCGYSSLADALNQNNIGLFYTIENVLESAYAEYEATKRRPRTNDGIITYGPLAGKELTWNAVNGAFGRGDFSNDGYTSLVEALDQNDIGVAEKYTIDDILESARLEHESTGKRPMSQNGLISYGPLSNRGITWKGVHYKIVHGAFKDCGYTSLADALNQNNIGTQKYTIDEVVESARQEYETTGRRPTNKDGLVKYGPLANKDINWWAVNVVISHGHLSNFGYKSLFDVLNQKEIGLKERCSIQDVIEAARAEYEATGSRPNSKGEEIEYGPLAGRFTWAAINFAITEGFLKDFGYTSLYDVLNKNEIGIQIKFTIEDIIESARTEHEKTGKRPVFGKDDIIHGPLANKGITWNKVSHAIKYGFLKNHGYSSLADLLDKNLVGIERFTIDEAIQSARLTFQETGKRPKQNDSDIKFGPLKERTEWSKIEHYIIRGYLKDCGYKSLADLLNKNGIGIKQQYTLQEILQSAKATYEQTGIRPQKHDGVIQYGPLAVKGIKWHSIAHAIGKGHLKGAGYKTLAQFLDAHNVPNIKPIVSSDPEPV